MINKLQRQINRIDRKGVFNDRTVEAYNKRTEKLEKLLKPKIEKEIKDYFKGQFLSKRDFQKIYDCCLIDYMGFSLGEGISLATSCYESIQSYINHNYLDDEE